MKTFKDFNPHLSGHLLDGVIPRYPKIQINLFSDNLKEIEYVLLNENIPFEFNEKTRTEKLTKKKSIRQVPVIYLEGKNFPVEIKVYAENDIFKFKKQLIKDRGISIEKIIES
jgi:glutaredoxin